MSRLFLCFKMCFVDVVTVSGVDLLFCLCYSSSSGNQEHFE